MQAEAVMEFEKGELDGFIYALLRDVAFLIPRFGLGTIPGGSYDKGSVRYQKVANALAQLEYVEHTLGAEDRLKWETTQLPNTRRNGVYLSAKARAIKTQLEQMGEGNPLAV